MQLKKIELQGFKSFADRVEIQFLSGVTTIVGPNGSGKSNISDAIKWVLGEQSVKTLRGSKMEDVIFAGTQNRKKVGFAEVSMYLDNSDLSLPVEYKEVVVSRKLYRTGESGYYINGNECRLKDIQELFMDTGIGKDGYSIISQGKIDEILSNKSEERRAIFEEASGIVKYRTRKEEAQKKLESTNENLSRVYDVLSEIQNNIGTLEKKAETAKKYLSLKEKLKSVEVMLFIKNVKENAEKLEALEDNIVTFQNDKALEEQVALDLEKAKNNIKERLEEILNTIDLIQTKYYESENENEKLNYTINLANEKITNSKINIERLNSEIVSDNSNISLLTDEISKKLLKEQALNQDKIRFQNELEQKQNEYNNLAESMSQKDLEIENIKSQIEITLSRKYEINELNSSIFANIDSSNKQLDLSLKAKDKNISQKDSISLEQTSILEDINRNNKALNEIELNIKNLEDELNKFNNDKSDISNKLHDLNTKLMTMKSKYNYLKNLENENEGYYKSVKSVLDYAKSNSMNNVFGTVASIISTEEKYEYAIEIALGGYLQNIVVENDNVAKNLINYLKQNSYGRATFLPLNSIKKYDNENSSKFKNFPGFIGLATDLIKYDLKFSNVISLALNRTIIVDNIDNAIQISKTLKSSVKIVTLDGELIASSGSITGGQTKLKSNGLIGRSEKIEELKTNIIKFEDDVKLLNEKASSFKEHEAKINEAINEQTQNRNNINIELATLNEKFNNVQKETQRIEEHAKNELEFQNRLQAEINLFEKNIEANKLELAQIEDALSKNQAIVDEYVRYNKDKQQAINLLNEDITNLKISLSSFEESVSSIDEIKLKIQSDIANFKNSILKKQKQIDEYKQDISKNEDLIKLTKENIDNLSNVKTEYSSKIENFKAEKAECTKKQDILELKTLQSVSKIDKIKEEISKLENKKVKYELEIENLKNSMWDDYELTLSSAKQYLETIPEMNESEIDLNKIGKNLHEEIKNLGDIDVNSIEEYKLTKERFDFISSQKEDLEQTKSKLENLISNMTVIMKQQFSSQFKIITENFNKTFKELFGGGRATLYLSDENNVLESGIEIEVEPPGKKLQSMMLLSRRRKSAYCYCFTFCNIKNKSSTILHP